MHANHRRVRYTLLALLWALSLTALCIPLGTVGGSAAGWARTLPDTGVWLIAMVALGLLYRDAGQTPRIFAKPRFWVLSALLAGVATLGESFAATGTAELVSARKGLALLYFAGRVPLIYLGFSLLLDWLSRNRPPRDGSFRYAGAYRDQPGGAPVQPPQSKPIGAQGRKAYLGTASPGMAAATVPAPNATGSVPPTVAERPETSRTVAVAQQGANGTSYPMIGGQPDPAIGRQAQPAARALPQAVASQDVRTLRSANVTASPNTPQGTRRHTGWDAEGKPLFPETPRAQTAQTAQASASQVAPRAQVNAAQAAPQAQVAAAQPTPYGRKATPPQDGGYANPPEGGEAPLYGYGFPRRRALPTWAYALILLLCWAPYLFAVWPGTVSNDSITQLAEIFGQKALSNGNPLAQTGLLWLFAQVGLGLFHSADAAVALYVCAQAALMAWLLGYALTRMQQSHAPVWLTGLSTAFFALNPIFPTFAFCVGKDTNFAMAVLWFTLMVWRVLESRWPPVRTVVGLVLSAVLCALLRNAGAGMAGLTLLVLLVWALTVRTKQWRAPLMALGGLLGTALALQLLIVPALQALPMPATENWSVPLQQVARTVASEPLTETEQAAIEAVLPVAELKAAYNGELSDPIKALWREGVTPEQRTVFFATWLRLGLKHPATYLSATFHNTYGYLLPGYVSTIKPTFLLGKEGHTTRIEGLFDFTVNPLAGKLKTALQGLFAFEPFRLAVAPGLYGGLTLFALAAMFGLRRRHQLVAMLPALLALLGCLFSAVNGYFRYAMPLYFTAPVLLALVSQATVSGPRARGRRGLRL